jgi:hypothetical protein
MNDERVRPVKTPIPKETTGLSLLYRFAWRMEYLGVSVFGPAQQSLDKDPKERLRRDRAARVAAARS